VATERITLTGKVTGGTGPLRIAVTLNGAEIARQQEPGTPGKDVALSVPVKLTPGRNTLIVTATDGAGGQPPGRARALLREARARGGRGPDAPAAPARPTPPPRRDPAGRRRAGHPDSHAAGHDPAAGRRGDPDARAPQARRRLRSTHPSRPRPGPGPDAGAARATRAEPSGGRATARFDSAPRGSQRLRRPCPRPRPPSRPCRPSHRQDRRARSGSRSRRREPGARGPGDGHVRGRGLRRHRPCARSSSPPTGWSSGARTTAASSRPWR